MEGLILVFVLLSAIYSAEGVKKQDLLYDAINGILRTHFVNQTSKDLVSFGDTSRLCADLFDKIMKRNSDLMSFRLRQGSEGYHWNHHHNKSSIVLFESVERFANASVNTDYFGDPESYKPSHQQIIHIENAGVDDIYNNVEDGFEIDNVAFLIKENEDTIVLVSNFIYTPDKCRVNQLLTINQFHRNTMRWENSNFYPNKYRNFHNCTLGVFRIDNDVQNKTISALSKSLNFRIVKADTSSTVDILTDCNNLFNLMERCIEFDREKDMLVVPFGEPYSAIWKMFLMFDTKLWIAIGVFLLTWGLLIQVINRMSMKVQNFVYGRNVRTPTMNLFDIFLNGGQNRKPGRNFARFHLMLFVFWCLIIRTCYQSMLYDYLQKDLRKPPVVKIDELLAKNFTFFDYRNNFDPPDFQIEKKYRVTYRFHPNMSIVEGLNFVADPMNKAVLMIYPNNLRWIENHVYRSGISSFLITKTVISDSPAGLTLMQFNSYGEVWKDKVLRLQAGGIIDHWDKQFVNPKGIKRVQEEIGPQVLTIDHVGIGFIICLAPLFFIMVVFVLESVIGYWKQMKKNAAME